MGRKWLHQKPRKCKRRHCSGEPLSRRNWTRNPTKEPSPSDGRSGKGRAGSWHLLTKQVGQMSKTTARESSAPYNTGVDAQVVGSAWINLNIDSAHLLSLHLLTIGRPGGRKLARQGAGGAVFGRFGWKTAGDRQCNTSVFQNDCRPPGVL